MAYKKLKYWFDNELAESLANKILVIEKSFPKHKFVSSISNSIDGLELKDRIEVFADAFSEFLFNDFEKTIDILDQIMGPENPDEKDMFNNYYWLLPVAKYVEKYGLEDFERSMKSIEEVTKRSTGEYAIRPFYEEYPEKTLQQMIKWTKSKNRNVRRLPSEGLRPRLPWAKKLDLLIIDPSPLIPILENLKDDSSKYVQKSVANCINDIVKDNPEIAKELLDSWQVDAISKERQWIIKHASRNL